MFKRTDANLKRLEHVGGWTYNMEQDTRQKVEAAIKDLNGKTEYLNKRGEATKAEMENIVTQQRIVIENIVVEMQNQRTGIDELYVASKLKL